MKLYVLVRADLTPSQRAVQAGHAVAEFLLTHKHSKWKNGILVYLRVPHERELRKQFDKFYEVSLGPVAFYEEDMGNEMTAIAATGVDDLVKDLPLL